MGVKMALIQDSQAISIASKVLRISGPWSKIAEAKYFIEKLISTDDNKGNFYVNRATPLTIGEIIVPRTMVGFIIGKGGETIKRIAHETGTKIQFKPDGNFYILKAIISLR